jgi:glycosyltransferase involved in cell wall biosynthesis
MIERPDTDTAPAPLLWVLTECYPRPAALHHCAFAHAQMVGTRRAGWDVRVLRPAGGYPPVLWRLARPWREARAEWIPPGWSVDGVPVSALVYQNRLPSRLNRPLDSRSRIARALVERLAAEGARPRRDLLLVHFALPYGPVALDASRRTGIPYAVFLRGDDVWILPHRDGARRMPLFREALGGASLVLGVSQSLIDEARRLVGEPFPPSAVVPNGIALDRFRPPASPDERARARDRLGAAPDETVLLCVGDALVRKGWLELLDAVGALPPSCGRVALVAALANDVDELDLVAEAMRRAPGVRFVVFRGLSPEQLAEAYRGADVFCLPSHWEGLSNALLEAMASGLACVTTGVAGHPEAVTDGADGFLVPPKSVEPLRDALARLLRSPELRREIGLAARRRAEAVGDSRKAGRRLAALLEGARAGAIPCELLSVDPYAPATPATSNV